MKKFTTAIFLMLPAAVTMADIVHSDDVIINGSSCVGFDCVNGENFGADTIRLKENNLRIHFDDTSSTGSFPSNDWRITINDQTNGGASFFAIDDATNNKTPFKVEANAPSNSLLVESSGDIGVGTANPVLEMHIKDGDTPGIRLEQDNSSGFAAQAWDVAGNETSFFVRDATNGSTLPFRIRPGAPSNSLYVNTNGNIGLRTTSPSSQLHVNESSSNTAATITLANSGNGTSWEFVHRAHVDEALAINNPGLPGAEFIFTQDAKLGVATVPDTQLHVNENTPNTAAKITLANSGNSTSWELVHRAHVDQAFAINNPGRPGAELILSQNGDLTIPGNITVGGTQLNVPDYVFDSSYKLMPIAELKTFIQDYKHLPDIPSESEVKQSGVNVTMFQMMLLKKIEELTLYTLEQDKQINQLKDHIQELKSAYN